MCELVVMVIESDEVNLNIICDQLQAAGVHRLLCFSRVSSAMSYLSKDPVDLVLVSGDHCKYSDLLCYIRDHLPYTLTMVIEKSEDPLDGLRAVSLGALEVVRSAHLASELRETLPSVIRRSESYLRLYDVRV